MRTRAGSLQMDISRGCTYPVYRLVLLVKTPSLISNKRVKYKTKLGKISSHTVISKIQFMAISLVCIKINYHHPVKFTDKKYNIQFSDSNLKSPTYNHKGISSEWQFLVP